ISDVGLVPLHLMNLNAHHYFLPLGPRLMLEGIYYFEEGRNSREPKVRTHQLSGSEADERFEIICLSAVDQILASQQDPKVPATLRRRQELASSVGFNKVASARHIKDAGLIDTDGSFQLRTVPTA